jgi:hypothetical protein
MAPIGLSLRVDLGQRAGPVLGRHILFGLRRGANAGTLPGASPSPFFRCIMTRWAEGTNMADETFDQNLLRMIAATLHFQTTLISE